MSSNPDFSDAELIEIIGNLKKQRNAVILAHNYVPAEIQDIADFCGDSLELSIKAADTAADVIVFCGVRFMAETAKILSPEKTVLLPVSDAGCAMAQMIDAAAVRELKRLHPGATVVCYVNSTAEVKTEVDVCCTSANAAKIVEKLKGEVIFVPDGNLARNVAHKLKRDDIMPFKGYCPIHNRFTVEMIKKRRREFPGAPVFVHPECPPDVTAAADAALSTGMMLKYVRENPSDTFVVGTEIGIIHRLEKENPAKKFVPLTTQAVCPDMKKIGLWDVYVALRDLSEQIELDEETVKKARGPIDRMIKG
ncbi:MAG: quinolinate synthase NadA [Victivallaceae bacterium]|nr:quinolinate synthase NadA [Victivallaceae bacterium]